MVEECEEGLCVLWGTERDGLVDRVADNGHGAARVLTNGGLSGDVPLPMELVAELREQGAGVARRQEFFSGSQQFSVRCTLPDVEGNRLIFEPGPARMR